MKTIILTVTTADIAVSSETRADSLRYDATHCCPLAVALARRVHKIRPELEIYANPAIIQAMTPTDGIERRRQVELQPTKTIIRFMRNWDRYCRAKPKRFRIPIRYDGIGLTK